MKPIFFTGYMASGKTTVGQHLAARLGLQFIDMDLFIENRYRKTVSEIFEERGESGFREIERRALQEVAYFENVVISTGGGLPCFFDNMEVMNATGLTVYLKTSAAELANRLATAYQKRPLIKGKSSEELKEFVKNSLQQRQPFYEKAAIIIDCETLFESGKLNEKIEEIMILTGQIPVHKRQ
ncbi:MAG: shikimate kinase [Dysgonamonadaceae bacterium]|nr:shikimate kinase [Dysgonamonadaceae bacterium]